MRQLHYTLAVILASLLAASSVAASSCPNFTKELLEDLLSNEARKITIANNRTLCDNEQQLTSDTERATTVIIEYNCSGDCVVTGHDYALVDIRCIDGIWNEESFAPRQSDLYGLVSTGGIIPNSCADCIDMTTLMNRNYPTNPPGNLDYNETTHCLSKFYLRRNTVRTMTRGCDTIDIRMRVKLHNIYYTTQRNLCMFLFTHVYTKHILVGSCS